MKPKKSLGQHFLKSKDAILKIIRAGEISRDDIILEIGPGKGILTQELLKRVNPAQNGRGKVIAVEKDRELFEFLQNKFEKEISEKKLILINEDILNLKIENLKLKIYKVISNIPYNITGAILKKFLTEKYQPERMVLLVQYEVAKRIMARDSKESILSISVKAYGAPELIGKVPRRYFSPEPKVDSAIIAIKNISRKNFMTPPFPLPLARGGPERGEDKFWEIVKKGFAHKRKKLSGNLKNAVPAAILASFGDKRAEDLTLEDWISLAR